MPIMKACATPEHFTKIFLSAMATLIIVYVFFGCLCYAAYGSNDNAPLITEMLPAGDSLVITTKLVYIINLIFSYALCIYPTNQSIESILFDKDDNSTNTYWFKNLSRAFVAISACFLGVVLADEMDKVVGLMGALLCAPLAITLPALVHFTILAETKREKIADIGLVVLSIFILVFSTAQSLMSFEV